MLDSKYEAVLRKLIEENTLDSRRKYYKPDEAAELVHVKTVTVYNWCKQEKIPYVKIAGTVRIPIDRFHKWLNDHTVDPK